MVIYRVVESLTSDSSDFKGGNIMVGDNRHKAKLAQDRRMRLLYALGERQGTLYKKHVDKIRVSSGYMRDGNVSHYVQINSKYRRKNYDKQRNGKFYFSDGT